MVSFPTDADGYLENTGSTDLIQPAIRPLVEEVVAQCRLHLGGAMVCMYVRGSVSVGEAYLGASDLDVVAVLREQPAQPDLQRATRATDVLLCWHSVVSAVDLTIVSLEQLVQGLEYSRLRVYLATRSALLYGEDVLDRLPRFRPNRALALYMYPDICQELRSLKRVFTGESAARSYLGRERPTSFWCVWTMRTVLRSAQALTMATEGVYDCELRACLDSTITVYPNLRAYLEQAYAWALRPTDECSALATYLTSYLQVFAKLWYEKVVVNQGLTDVSEGDSRSTTLVGCEDR